MKSTVFATGCAYSGFHTWPHEPGEKSTKEVTYTNTGDAPVTLDLAIKAPEAPEGVFTLSTTQVTVPAHGTGKVTVTANLDRVALGGHYGGMVDASGADGKVLAHTLIGVGKESERYNLSVTAKDRSGKPLAGQLMVAGDKRLDAYEFGASGTGTLRLPAGTYGVWLQADVQGTHGPHSLGTAMLSAPEIILDRDRAVTLDASKARQVTAVTPQKTTDSDFRMDNYRSFGPDDYAVIFHYARPYYDSMWALPTGKKVTKGEFVTGARWRKKEPMLTVASDRRSFDDLRVQRASTPLPEGRMELDTVFAGQGAEADFAGLRARGKVAVVRRNDAVTVEQQADAAVKAGARLMLVVNDGIGRLDPWTNPIWAPPPPAPLTVATLTRDEGEELIAQIQRGRTPLTLLSSPTTDYLYDLVHHYDGAVPADPTYRPEKRDLARVDVSFRNYQQDSAIEFRADFWQGFALSSSIADESPAQGERTDWVSADADIQWRERAELLDEVQESSPAVRYAAGTSNDLHWFGPVHRPRLHALTEPTKRQDDAFYISIPGWGDSGGDHAGTTAVNNPEVMNDLTLYQGDTLLQRYPSDSTTVSGLSPERLPYRLVSENSRGTWANPYSTSTRTEWGFSSAAGAPEAATMLPLIQLDYKVDVDTAGKAHRNADLTVTPSHLPGGPSSKAINALTLDISYDDGATWQKAALTHTGDGWKTRLHAPAKTTYVTLRTTAHDGLGNSVAQSITRAFGLK